MPAPPAEPAERVSVRRIIVYSGFTALLVFGLVLFFRYAGLIAPLLDVVTER